MTLHQLFSILLCLLLAFGCRQHDYETIVIRGSDTEVNLVLRLAEEYMDQDAKISIAVTGGGSGTGIASLINKRTAIANSSRAFKASEKKLAKERGLEVIPIIFAIDALSFVINDQLAVDSLSLPQLRAIFTGKIKNWSAVGGPDLDISLYGRQGNSGTFTFIQKHILQADYSLDMKQMNGTSQIIESLKNDKAGIGYVGIGYIVDKNNNVTEKIKVLSVREEQANKAISPLVPQNITSGQYPIVRPLYQYLDGLPTGKLLDFLKYELSEEGQKIISENGYYPITAHYKKHNQQYLTNE